MVLSSLRTVPKQVDNRMDLSGLKFGSADDCGLCVARAVDSEGLANLQLLRLTPGVKLLDPGNALVPANVAGAKLQLKTPAEASAPSGLKLRRYQLEAIEFIEQAPLGAINACDVGLGKTATALAVLHRHPEWRPFVVVAPLIGMSVWCGEHADAFKHFNLTVHPLRTRSPAEEKFPAECDGYFINYDILHHWLPWFVLYRSPKMVIVDESHQVRHVQPRTSKAVHKLCCIPDVRKRILLTATPVISSVMDLYHQLDCVQPKCWGKYCKYNVKMLTSFGSQYGSEFRDEYGIKFGGESNVLELRARLANVMFRRSRYEVRDELPPLVRQAIRLPTEALDQKALKQYESALLGLDTFSAGARLKQGTAMASSLSWSKRAIAADHALNLARQRGKVVLFCWYKRMAKYLAEKLKDEVSVFGPVTGEKDIADRMDEADRFRDLELAPGESAVFVATLGAAAVSMNQLSAASAALFVDLYWVPALLLQAEGRVHREGQRASDVLIQYLLADGTMDDVMWKHLERKAKAIGATTGDSTSKTLVEDLGGADEKSSMSSLLGELESFGQAELELT